MGIQLKANRLLHGFKKSPDALKILVKGDGLTEDKQNGAVTVNSMIVSKLYNGIYETNGRSFMVVKNKGK